MHRDYRHNQDDDHRYRRKSDKRTEKDGQFSDKLDDDRRQAHQKREGNAYGVQHIDEILRATDKLRITVLHKAKADNKPKWNGVPRRRNGQRRSRELAWASEVIRKRSLQFD